LQGGSAPRNTYQGGPPQIKGNQRPSGPAMTSPASAISGAPYRGAGWTPQGYAPQAYRYTAPLAQPAYAYTQHTTAVSSSPVSFFIILRHEEEKK